MNRKPYTGKTPNYDNAKHPNDMPEFINIKGKEYITFNGALQHGHKNGLDSIDTEMLKAPTKESDLCIFKATVTVKFEDEEQTYTGHGDATKANVGPMIVPHILRMAETRAIGRALRMAFGLGTLLEELNE